LVIKKVKLVFKYIKRGTKHEIDITTRNSRLRRQEMTIKITIRLWSRICMTRNCLEISKPHREIEELRKLSSRSLI